MSEKNPLVGTLEDFTIGNEGAGLAPKVKAVGSDTTGNAQMVLAFRDSAGNLVLPQLTPDGRLPVTNDAAGLFKKAYGLNAGTAVEAAVATLSLTVLKTYVKVGVSVSSFVESIFRIVQKNDATETDIGLIRVGAGAYTAQFIMPEMELTAGATGVQSIIVYGRNLLANKVSQFDATITAVEVSA